MDNDQVMKKEKLGFYGIFKQTLKLPIENPNLILVFLITSFPLFFLSLLKEIIGKQSVAQVFDFFSYLDQFYSSDRPWSSHLLSIRELIENVSLIRLLSSLILLGIIYILDLLSTIIVVYTASAMYAGEANGADLKQILCRPIKKAGFRGPLITSICALILSLLTAIGLAILALGTILFKTTNSFFILVFAVLLLAKHIEWSAIWNMGTVISILEEKHEGVAMAISWYLSKGSRKRGFLLGFLFYAWNCASKMLCARNERWRGRGIGNWVEGIAVNVYLDSVSNFVMWVGLVVYFHDCKRRLLEKKINGEEVEELLELVLKSKHI